ncbi:hypothetical protein PTTG_25926 [Puccinia triticina 1-1 BBBD Race 1]|uniref:Uncharacterized protein n=1 Tax=Puccinia triticina (isolate 1-1 / race 1 (BBBD)) TaxID=630390 RepID=A0A180H058_PUCT1|nr:hypothetical protein PTTG_25926 [Puccinia triticina 1-1 BBBD Race 1]
MQNFLVIPVGLLILLQVTIGSPTPIARPDGRIPPGPHPIDRPRYSPPRFDCDCPLDPGSCCAEH